MDDNTKNLKTTLGAHIRSLRNERKMKLSDLAERSGLTPSTISQIERAQISPSISSLKKICDAMGVSIGYLFDDEKRTDTAPVSAISKSDMENYLKMFQPTNRIEAFPVVKKEKRKVLIPAEGVRYYLLNPNLAGPIEMIYNEFDPGGTTGPTPYTHPGNECGVVLSGEITVKIGDNTHILKEGDSISFLSSEPHMISNDSDALSTCIWVNVPPWF
jgi:transcriptional regulator with XRE-family HTH domain